MNLNRIKNTKIRFSDFYQTFINKSLIALIILIPVLLGVSCNTTEERVEEVGGVSAQQVIENPGAYVGKTVTVSGDVEEIWGPRAFNMDSSMSIGELLVIGREPFPQVTVNNADTAYVINDIATVKGVVRLLVKADIEREIGWDLDPKIVAEFDGKPVLVAESVSFKPSANRTATTAPSGTEMNNTNPNSTDANNMSGANGSVTDNDKGENNTGDRITDVAVFAKTSDKTTLAGKKGQFENVRVERIVGPRTFTVGSGSEEIYVMLEEDSARAVGTQGKIDKGDTVTVSGEFEKLNMEEINDIKNARFRPLTDAERSFLKQTKVYFQADKVSGSK